MNLPSFFQIICGKCRCQFIFKLVPPHMGILLAIVEERFQCILSVNDVTRMNTISHKVVLTRQPIFFKILLNHTLLPHKIKSHSNLPNFLGTINLKWPFFFLPLTHDEHLNMQKSSKEITTTGLDILFILLLWVDLISNTPLYDYSDLM